MRRKLKKVRIKLIFIYKKNIGERKKQTDGRTDERLAILVDKQNRFEKFVLIGDI